MTDVTYHCIIFNIKNNNSKTIKKQIATTTNGKNIDADNSAKIVIKFFIYL